MNYWVYAQNGTLLMAGMPGVIDEDEDTLVITGQVTQGNSIKTGTALYRIYNNADQTPPPVGGGLLHCTNINGQSYTFPL